MQTAPPLPELTPDGCAARRTRLAAWLAAEGCDAALLSNPKSLLYFFNVKLPVELSAYALLRPEGSARLLTPFKTDGVCGAELMLVDARDQGGPRNDRHALVRAQLPELLEGMRAKRLAVEAEHLSWAAAETVRAALPGADWADCGPVLRQMRRKKDADELNLIRASIRATEAGYAALPRVLAHARTELDAYAGFAAAVAEAAGTALGIEGDFASGERGVTTGGPPLNLALKPGDFYIFDVFPAVHGYRGDLCRTAVLGVPTPAQLELWAAVRAALRSVEPMIRPGVRCAAVHAAVARQLHAHPQAGASYWHHTGHGVGLDPHESPRITAASADLFEVGDVFTLEPGLYQPALGGGIRLEDNYLVTATGIERLSQFPLELLTPEE